jgi:uncharacterized OB-fold protein
MTTQDVPFRILPKLTEKNRDFWTGGDYIHPPSPLCPRCHSKHMKTEAVSGRATLATFSVNYQPWMPGPELPYIVAIAEMVEQVGLRIMTNLVNCAPDDARIDMPLRVVFEHHPDPEGDVYLPLFEPES